MSEEAKRIIKMVNRGELPPLEQTDGEQFGLQPLDPKEKKQKARPQEIVFKMATVLSLIAAFIFLSVARHDSMEKAAEQAELIREHKENEERLTNELAAALQQKADTEKRITEEFIPISQFDSLKDEIEDLQTIIKNQAETIEEQERTITGLQEKAPNPYASIKLTDEEEDIFAWVVALEAKNEPEIGRRAVVETACNRYLSDEWKGDTIGAILSAPGQYDGYKIMQEYRAGIRTSLYAYPDETERQTIRYVLEHGNTALPLDYVYFATYKANGRDFIQIGNHYFGR